MSVRILVGDMAERLRDLPDVSVDSCVTDPPYHLTSIVKRFGKQGSASAKVGATGAFARSSRGFMGQQWDGGDVAFREQTWAEVLRVLKPGAHLVAFSGTRTYHRMVCAIEDAGFEVRDQLAWIYGSGFPKSHNLGDGWGTALKPAWEPICLARKPLIGTNVANMAAHGVGGLNIDGCRIEAQDKTPAPVGEFAPPSIGTTGHRGVRDGSADHLGRWPANIVHDGSDEVVAAFPDAPGQMATVTGNEPSSPFARVYGEMPNRAGSAEPRNDSGSAARFFYCGKATSEERGQGNNHPTVKPVALMRWLTRLVTPKGGLVLDPFTGSGSTALACEAEQFNFVGCELSPDYAAIAERRIRDAAGMFADISVERVARAA